MKQYAQLFLFLSFALFVRAKGDLESEKWTPEFNVYQTTVNTNLIPQQCQVKLHFLFGDTIFSGRRIYMSINGVLEDLVLQNSDPVVYDLTPGKYLFKIWAGPGYEEIITDSIEFASQTVNDATVRISSAIVPVTVSKPVIYFHSEKDLTIDVNVDPVGNFIFTYPEIGSGWSGEVKKDGSFFINGQNFPYLFWESDQMYAFKSSDNGFKVDKKDIVAFLEKKCDEFGFNSRETTDFITYWGPKLASFDSVFIQYAVDESCAQFADLNITPVPNDLKRVYIQFTPWSDVMLPYLKDKTFDPVSTGGFTVLEWGGFQFTLPEMAF